MRFLSALASCTKPSERGEEEDDEEVDDEDDELEDAEDVELMDADEDVGEDSVETVDEVDERCRSIGEGFSSSLVLALVWWPL